MQNNHNTSHCRHEKYVIYCFFFFGRRLRRLCTKPALGGSVAARALLRSRQPSGRRRRNLHARRHTQYVERSADGKRLVVKEISSGEESSVLFDITHTRETVLPDFEDFILSPDASKILISRDSRSIYRRSHHGAVLRLRSALAPPPPALGLAPPRARPLFSPDSRMVAFVADGNIYAAKLDYNTEVAVTTDAKPGEIINGATDWTYEEEFGVTSLWRHGPPTTSPSATCASTKAACPSTPSPSIRARAAPGRIRPLPRHAELQISRGRRSQLHRNPPQLRRGDPQDQRHSHSPEGDPCYIPRIAYGSTPEQLMVSTLNRDQNRFRAFQGQPQVDRRPLGVCRRIEGMDWAPRSTNSSRSTPTASSSPPRHPAGSASCATPYAGQPLGAVSMDNADATDFYGSDAAGHFYFRPPRRDPSTAPYTASTAKGRTEAISPDHGTASAVFAPGCTAYTPSLTATPPRLPSRPCTAPTAASSATSRPTRLTHRAPLRSKCPGVLLLHHRRNRPQRLHHKARRLRPVKRYP